MTLAFAIAAAAAPIAGATTLVGGSPVLQLWLDQAKVATPDATLRVVELEMQDPNWPCRYGEGGQAAACVEPRDGGHLFISPSFWAAEAKETEYHETGHLFDGLYLTDADRAWFASKIGVPAVPWLEPANHQTAGESFAQQYAVCALRGKRIRYPELILPEADDREVGPRLHRRLCIFIERAFTTY